MSAQEPEAEEVSIDWTREGDRILVTATLGEATIALEGDLEDDHFATLINSTAAIMNAVVENINQEDS